MNIQMRHGCWIVAGAFLLLVLVPLVVLAYWTLFLKIDDTAAHQGAARLLAASSTAPTSRSPVLIVHGLWDGDADQASICAATAGPFAHETLLAEQQYIPLHDIGPWLIADGYAPYYAILTTSPDYTPTFAENGRCLEQQLRNWVARVDQPSPKFTVIAHSMGGLVVRACLAQSEFCRTVIKQVITLGTPHNGTHPLLGWKTGRKDCSADPGLCELVDARRIAAFNAQAPNLPGLQYTFIGGTQGLLQHLPLLHENDGLVSAWSAIGMRFTADDKLVWPAWTKPNPPTVYFVSNKHAVSRRAGFAYSEAPAPGQTSEAYACMRYALGVTDTRPAVCRTPANPKSVLLP